MTKPKGKTPAKSGPVNADRLKSFVERIEKLEEEQKAVGGDKRDIYTEAKSAGYNPKALRKIVQQRRAKDDPELDADMDTYRRALGMAVEAASNGDMSLRKAAKAFGVSKSAVHRAVPREEKSATGTPHDPETGEITEGQAVTAPNAAVAGGETVASGQPASTPPENAQRRQGMPVPEDDHGRADASDIEKAGLQETTDAVGTGQGADSGGASEAGRAAEGHGADRGARETPPREGGEPGLEVPQATALPDLPSRTDLGGDTRGKAHTKPADTRTFDEITGPPLDFLDRRPKASQPTGEVPQ